MRTALAAAVVALFVISTGIAHAGDMKVSYRVDLKALRRSTTASTPLTFQLFGDPACKVAASAPLAIGAGDVAIIEQPKAVRLRGSSPQKATALIENPVNAKAVASPLYARVTGTGIVPLGSACQLQTGSTSTGLIFVDATGAAIGPSLGKDYKTSDAPLTVAIAGPGGELFSARLSTNGFVNRAYVVFDGSDCTGQASILDYESQSLSYGFRAALAGEPLGGNAEEQATGFFALSGPGVKLYVPSGDPPILAGPDISIAFPSNIGACVVAGGNFTPPSTCCEPLPNAGGLFGIVPAVPIDVGTFTPPFRFVAFGW